MTIQNPQLETLQAAEDAAWKIYKQQLDIATGKQRIWRDLAEKVAELKYRQRIEQQQHKGQNEKHD